MLYGWVFVFMKVLPDWVGLNQCTSCIECITCVTCICYENHLVHSHNDAVSSGDEQKRDAKGVERRPRGFILP